LELPLHLVVASTSTGSILWGVSLREGGAVVGFAAMARGSAMSAMAVLLLVMGMCVHGSQALVCEKDFKEKGCNRTVEELFTADMFEAMFNHRNDRVSHAQNFWTYDGFMSAAKMFEKDGFGSVGGDDMQKRELAAFFAHVAHETSCMCFEVDFFISISYLRMLLVVVCCCFAC